MAQTLKKTGRQTDLAEKIPKEKIDQTTKSIKVQSTQIDRQTDRSDEGFLAINKKFGRWLTTRQDSTLCHCRGVPINAKRKRRLHRHRNRHRYSPQYEGADTLCCDNVTDTHPAIETQIDTA
jgi:hypothetical protein